MQGRGPRNCSSSEWNDMLCCPSCTHAAAASGPANTDCELWQVLAPIKRRAGCNHKAGSCRREHGWQGIAAHTS